MRTDPQSSTSQMTSSPGYRWAGITLAIGGLVLLIGELFYLPLGTTLALPTAQSSYGEALSLGRSVEQFMWPAGYFSVVGDALITVACLSLLGRSRALAFGDLERVSWALIGVGLAVAICL